MTEITNSNTQIQCNHEQILHHQQILIHVLKQQIMRLQLQLIDHEQQNHHINHLYQSSLDQIQLLKQKIQTLKQNNSSLLHTLNVFQRQFVKRDYKPILHDINNYKQQNSQTPLFLQLIRTIKMKFSQPSTTSLRITQKSQMNEYYGFFLHQDISTQQLQLYNDITTNKLKLPKLKSYGKKSFFNQKYRHCFWFNTIPNTLKLTQTYYQYLLDIYSSNQQNQNPNTRIINLDLKRMDLKIQQNKIQFMKSSIKKCLEIFKLYRPDIGYVQGMSYLAWMLLIRMEGYHAFVSFANMILCDPFICSLYFFQAQNLKKIIQYFNQCLSDKKPKLYKHMQNLLVQPSLFIIQWSYTMFSRAFSLRLSSQILVNSVKYGIYGFVKDIISFLKLPWLLWI